MDYKKLLALAYAVARGSQDESSKIGALIIDPVTENTVASEANRFPTMDLFYDRRNHERPRKYAFTEHAERGVIYNCAAEGIQTKGKIMVATAACCADCARAIALCGITLVVTHKQCMERFGQAWQDSIAQGCEILESYGVAYRQWSGQIGCGENLCNGEVWRP